MTLKEQILTILVPVYDFSNTWCKIRKIDNGYEINFGAEYESPNLSFAKLMKLAELFGTTNIDVDDYAQGGCETCDFGSCYGHDIQVREPTKLIKELDELVGKDLYAKC